MHTSTPPGPCIFSSVYIYIYLSLPLSLQSLATGLSIQYTDPVVIQDQDVKARGFEQHLLFYVIGLF